jgi:hypothetical protein
LESHKKAKKTKNTILRLKMRTIPGPEMTRKKSSRKHIENVFKPFPSELSIQEENEITNFLHAPFQMELPTVNPKLKK